MRGDVEPFLSRFIGVDPTPVEVITLLKERMAAEGRRRIDARRQTLPAARFVCAGTRNVLECQ